jgi:hypothetical protein
MEAADVDLSHKGGDEPRGLNKYVNLQSDRALFQGIIQKIMYKLTSICSERQ